MTFTPRADAEALVRGWLAGQFTPIRVVTELPANLADVAPIIQVSRFGGSDRAIVLDDANVDVDYFDGPHDGLSARENARLGAERVRTALVLHLPGVVTGGGVVTEVRTISAPRWVPYDNTQLRRFVASYRITIRSVPA